jgi:hypothetical protein
MDGIASKCRDRLPDDSLRIFQEMKMYTEYVSRIKLPLLIK